MPLYRGFLANKYLYQLICVWKIFGCWAVGLAGGCAGVVSSMGGCERAGFRHQVCFSLVCGGRG